MRVALIGCGAVGRRRAQALVGDKDSRLVIAVDRDVSRARTIGRDIECEAGTDWETVLRRDDINAVIVSTPHDVLAPAAVCALRHGKHVLVEKPMARTVDEATSVLRETVDAGRRRLGADGRPLVLKVGFNHRYHRALAEAHRALSRGEIGEAFFIRCRYGHGGRPGYEREWRLRRDLAGGGEVLDQGIHALDLFRWFLGDFDVAVGFLSTYFWRAVADAQEGDQVEDNGFGLFRTSRAQVASLHVSWTQWKNLFSFEVFGRDGSLTVDGLGGSYGAERLTRARRRPAGGPPQEQVTAFPGPDPSWEREWDAFVTAVREERCPEGNGYDGLEALKMVQALYEAHRKGTVVRISNGA